MPDGASIRITIEIGGRDAQQVLAQESEGFRHRRLAFEQFLALVTTWVRENLRQ